ncbi:MAG: hypothetical protein PHD43_16150 [Methylococcales bacterium]|nr:hypothetical protein [Methylococcales bacterium]
MNISVRANVCNAQAAYAGTGQAFSIAIRGGLLPGCWLSAWDFWLPAATTVFAGKRCAWTLACDDRSRFLGFVNRTICTSRRRDFYQRRRCRRRSGR